MENYENFIIDYDESGNMILLEYTGHEKKLVLPEEITAFAEDSEIFSGNTELEEIELNENLVFLPDYSFAGCTKLKKIHLPNGLRTISMKAFENCENLESINFPKRLKTIGPDAFKNCKNLKNVSLPSKIQEIHKNSFENTEELLLKNSAYETDGGIVYNKLTQTALFSTDEAAQELRIKKGTKTVGWGFSARSQHLEKISFPNSLISIGTSAFMLCKKIEEVRFPPLLASIEAGAFANCENLKNIKFKGDTPVKIAFSTFLGCPNLKEVTLPKDSEINPEAFDKECKILFF